MKKRATKVLTAFRNPNVLLYIAMSILGSSNKKKVVVPELLYTLKKEDILKLITVLGGENLYIPTATEFKFFMECAIAGYYRKCQEQPWAWIEKTMDINGDKLAKIKKEVEKWLRSCSNDELKVLNSLKEQKGDLCV